MPRLIIKIKDRYFAWSTIVDAPVTHGMTLEQFKRYYRSEYGETGMLDLADRLTRVEATGTSSHLYADLNELIAANRAGENETRLSVNQIYEQYVQDAQK